jgi:hypothetical protein
MNRIADIKAFYQILAALEAKLGGKRLLSDCTGRLSWPRRGVYFFFESGEIRSDSGEGPRVVRVGTHATTAGSKSRLWSRLSQHRGTTGSGGGNHRGSIMRLLVGVALKKKSTMDHIDTWGVGQSSTKAALKLGVSSSDLRQREHVLESAVSQYIRAMPFLWVDVDDAPDPKTDRGVIERNSIGLLSNYTEARIDRQSDNWLGRYCDRERVQRSGLWNNNHVDEGHDPEFLAVLERYVVRMDRSRITPTRDENSPSGFAGKDVGE